MKELSEKDASVLEHIIRHCKIIADCLRRFGNDIASFKNDQIFRDAVGMNILQIGELVTHLSEEYLSDTKEQIPWRQIRALRNIYAHTYEAVDDGRVWEVINNDIPELQSFCEEQINQMKSDFDNDCDEDDLLL